SKRHAGWYVVCSLNRSEPKSVRHRFWLPPREVRGTRYNASGSHFGGGLMPTVEERVRIAAMADMHCTRTSQGTLQRLLTAISESADVFLLCGDLTDYGLPEETHT